MFKSNIILTLIALFMLWLVMPANQENRGYEKIFNIAGSDIIELSYFSAGTNNMYRIAPLNNAVQTVSANKKNTQFSREQGFGIYEICSNSPGPGYGADSALVKQLLSTAADLEIIKHIKDKALDSDLKEYGLNEKNRYLHIKYRKKRDQKIKRPKEGDQDKSETGNSDLDKSETGNSDLDDSQTRGFEIVEKRIFFGKKAVTKGSIYVCDQAGRISLIALSQENIFDKPSDYFRDKRLLPVNAFNIKYAAFQDKSGLREFEKTGQYRFKAISPRSWEADWQRLYAFFIEFQQPGNTLFVNNPNSKFYETLKSEYTFFYSGINSPGVSKMEFFNSPDYSGVVVKSPVTGAWMVPGSTFQDVLKKGVKEFFLYRSAFVQTHQAREIVFNSKTIYKDPRDFSWYVQDSNTKAGVDVGKDKIKVIPGLVEKFLLQINSMRALGHAPVSEDYRLHKNADYEISVVTGTLNKKETFIFRSAQRDNHIFWYNSEYNDSVFLDAGDYNNFLKICALVSEELEKSAENAEK
jgi:hypothetical protein